jgi:hypothetical protein
MRRRRIVAVIGIAVLVGAGLVAVRGRAKTCAPVSFGHGEKIYGISSGDIGDRLSCRTARSVARASAARHFASHVRGWTVVYHRDCQCHTASRRIAGRSVTFTFNATKRR